MTTQATMARAAATHFEAKKTGFGQAQDGWSLTLRIQDNDLPAHIMNAKKGTRYMVALVEIGDDEEPVIRESKPPVTTYTDSPPRPSVVPASATGADIKERRPFSALPYPQQAALRCNDPIFWAFLRECCSADAGDVRDAEQAKLAIYKLCDIGSRADIKPGTEAEDYWLALEKWFAAWQTADRVGLAPDAPADRALIGGGA